METMDLCLIFIVFCHITWKVGSRQIHEDLRLAVETNREELLQFFDVDSIDSVPEYDITFIQPQRTRRDIDENPKNYKLTAFNKDFQLALKPSEVVSRTLIVMKKLPGNVWTKDLYTPEGTFLQGHVVSDSHSHVAVRELQEAEMTGTFIIEDHMYKLHPINERVKGILSLKGHGHHVITKRSIKDPKSEIFHRANYPEPVRDKEGSDDKESHINHRVRRDLGKKYIEAMITMDKVSCDYYGKVSIDYILAVANMANRIYKDKSIGINVDWVLTKIMMIQGYEEGLDVKKHNIDSAVRYLHFFSIWAKNKNTAAGQVEHFDNGVLLSRKICGLKDCGLEGVAYSGYPCSLSMGFTVNNARGLDAGFFVAHEMAHNFGITHDSGACAKGYMMNSGQAYGPNAFQWSNCSRRLFQNIFSSSRASCYNNIPPANITLPKLPPGHDFDADQQCKFISGPQYRICPVTTNNCQLLFCVKVGGCFTLGTSPVDGTPCGNRKWCVSGHCVDVGTSIPPSVDGGWSAWGPLGACSRTCGGGVRHRTRLCNNPSPKHHGKPCPGSAIGEWEICNIQDCGRNAVHYRTYQCLSKNPQYSRYYIHGSRCYLWCISGGQAYGEGKVEDGTKYMDDPRVLDICIAGQRVPVGCDHGIRSGKFKDRCMKCKGNGSTCVRVEGTYTKLWNQNGPSNADPMFVIPINATKFFIKENSYTNNILNLKLYPAQSNSLIFPNRPANSSRDVAGTTVFYDITNTGLNYSESMFFDGPTTKRLVPMFVYINQPNVGYRYHYYIPGRDENSAFVWQTVLTGECSRICAKGLRPQTVTCHRDDDKTRVDDDFCNKAARPQNTKPCNTQPCQARWEPQPWGPCSSRCGGGTRTRLVPCLQQVTSIDYRTVESYHCNTSRPNRAESCNQVDCGPAWAVGEWSECFALNNSQLIAKRFVRCQNKLANGTIIVADHKDCIDVDNVVPKNIKNCTITPTTIGPTTTEPTTDGPTTKEGLNTTHTTVINETTTEPQGTDKTPGGLEQSSMAVWLPITLTLIVAFSVAIMVVLLFRGGYLPCQHGHATLDGMKLQYVQTSEA